MQRHIMPRHPVLSRPRPEVRSRRHPAPTTLLLAGLLVLFLGAPAASAQIVTAGQMAAIERITAEELAQRLQSGAVLLLDTREQEEFEQERIPGAIRVPRGQLSVVVETLPRDLPIVTYCDCEQESLSARMAVQLEGMGFEDVTTLLGGLEAWRQGEHELESGPVVVPEDEGSEGASGDGADSGEEEAGGGAGAGTEGGGDAGDPGDGTPR